MSLGPFMVDIAGTDLSSEDVRVLSHPMVGSVILFSRNYRDRAQVAQLTAAIRAIRAPHLLIAVDHEGGRVQRFRDGFTRLPPSRLLGRRFDGDRRGALKLAQSVGWLMAGELRAVGVDFSFAPCIDLDYGVSDIIGDRSFHADAEAVAALGVAYAAGMRDAGMAATAKHFPGHGAVVADSHVDLPVDRRSLADMEADMRPYRLLIRNNLAAVMAAHVVYPALDDLPASLSQRWVQDVLRGDLGFHGCVFADDLSMAGAAAFGGILQRVKLAFAAGCDVLPICNDRHAVQSVLEHFGAEFGSPASQARLVRMRGRGEPGANLGDNRQWQETVSDIANLSATPPLVLTEGKMTAVDDAMYRRLVETSPEGVVLVDALNPVNPVLYANPAFEALSGYPSIELVGRNLRLLQGDDREQDARHRLREALSRGEPCRVLLRNYRKDGSLFWNESSILPLKDESGRVTHFIGHHRDAGERLRIDPKVSRDSMSGAHQPTAIAVRDDRLTGLFTLPYLEELLKRDWTLAQREKRSIAIFAIDIDALDLYNTTFGRAAGDSTIRRVAHVVSGCLRRSSDVTARIDGGSLIAFAPGVAHEAALRLGQMMAERVRELRIHHPRSAVLRYISISVGVGAAVPVAEESCESLLKQAQARLQQAKNSGRNQAA